MQLQHNTFKAALAAGRPQLGVWSTIASPIVAEILAHSAFDWVMFDAEHTAVEIAGLQPLLQAASSGRAHAVVRPPWNDPVMIKRVLDIGAQSILLPYVQNAAEAKAAVDGTRYPPVGTRGVSAGTRAGGYGRRAEYLLRAADDLCVLVQVETLKALAELSSISTVDGVDGVFIGPSDLSASMGYIGQPSHAEVQSAIQEAANTIRAAGKAPGILATSAEDARRYLEWGYLFVACGVDMSIMVKGIDNLHRQTLDAP